MSQRIAGVERIALTALSVLLCSGHAQAQSSQPGVSTLDEFGNAQHRYSSRSYQGAQTPFDLSGTSDAANPLFESRRSLRRRGVDPSPLGNNLLTPNGLPGRSFGGSSGDPYSYSRQYGVLDRRVSTGFGNMAMALQRRRELIQSFGLTAPVRQAMQRHAGFIDPLRGLIDVPVLDAESEAGADVTPIALDVSLDERAAASYSGKIEEGWTWFRDGKFRLASRTFEAAGTLRPDELDPLIGELFSHAAVGSLRTAATLVGDIAKRSDNPFSLIEATDIGSRFARPTSAGDLAIETRLFASADATNADAAALNVLVLAYVGRRDDALAAANVLSRNFSGSLYAGWKDQLAALPAVAIETP